uniref:Uncharacterized protein n=1 Tax=Xiphophorus couchianus TaxID=32473 RepID=A0A3B5M1W3_9TELE
LAARSRLCSVWLGSETGILKGVSLDRKQAFNFSNTRALSRDQEVRALCWADPAESELLLGCADGTVRTFSTEKGVFTEARSCGDPQEGCFSGLASLRGSAIITCAECGKVRVWREDGSGPVAELDAGSNVCRMRQSPMDPNRVATGGKENGLKIWDLERPEKPLFTAKNLRDDWLDLRRPHWVRDMGFIPDSDKVVTCTGYHQVHVFDPATPQRRPVLEAEFGEYPLTALALPCHASQPLVASCGLDRFLRVHSLEDQQPLHRVYLKSRLTCLLLASRELQAGQGGGATEGAEPQVKEEEEDEVWDRMERVEEEEEATKRKPAAGEEEVKKKKKKKGGD